MSLPAGPRAGPGTTPATRRRALGLLLACVLPPATAAETAVVDIRDYRFTPQVLTIKAGTTVTWTNSERRTTHSVQFLGPGGLESERLFPGESWQRRFDTPGEYPYACGPHPEMRGGIVVTP